MFPRLFRLKPFVFTLSSCFFEGAYAHDVSLQASLTGFNHSVLSYDPSNTGKVEPVSESVTGFVPELRLGLNVSLVPPIELGAFYSYRFSWHPDEERVSEQWSSRLSTSDTASVSKIQRHEMTGYVKMGEGPGRIGLLARGGLVRSDLFSTTTQGRTSLLFLPWVSWEWSDRHESYVFSFYRRDIDTGSPEISVQSSHPRWLDASGGLAHRWSMNAYSLAIAYVQESLLSNDPWFDHTKRGGILAFDVTPWPTLEFAARLERGHRSFQLPWKRIGSCREEGYRIRAYYAKDPLDCSRNENERFFQVEANWVPKPGLRLGGRYFFVDTDVTDLKEFDTSTRWFEFRLSWQIGGQLKEPSVLDFLPYDKRQFDRQGF